MDRHSETYHGRPVAQCTSYNQDAPWGMGILPLMSHHYPQPVNSQTNRVSPNQEPRQSDEAIGRMLNDEYQPGSEESNSERAVVTRPRGPSSGIGSISSNDDVLRELAQLSLSLSSSSSSCGSEDPFPRRKVQELPLRKLSSKLGIEWEKLASMLGFSHVDIQRFKYNVPNNLEDQIFMMLITWRCTKADHATPHKLAKALKECGRTDLANEITDLTVLQEQEAPNSPRRIPNQLFNNLLANLTELTEKDREKIVLLIRPDILTGDGESLTGQNGKPPGLLEIIKHLEMLNYLDANNVWYLQYLLKQLDKKDLYEMVWKYAMRRFRKHDTLFLHEPTRVIGKNRGVLRFKIIGKTEHFGGMRVEEFKAMLAKKFDGEVRHINDIGARDGCIELFFQVPTKLMEKIVTEAATNESWFCNMNIMEVQAEGDDPIFIQEKPEYEQTAELTKEMLLLMAIINHDKQELEQLLSDGACPQFKIGGKWLLQWVIFMSFEENKEEFVELLLEHGADQFAKDEMGMTAEEEAKFLGRCRQALTFTPKKPTQFINTEETLQFIPRLTSDNIKTHTNFLWEKRQFVCIPCKKIWQEVVWGLKPYSRCKHCNTDYYPMSKITEYPRRRVKCNSCNIVFTTFRHPYIPKHCRNCKSVVTDCSIGTGAGEHNRGANNWSHNPLPVKVENMTAKFLESLVHLKNSVWCDVPPDE